MSWIPVVTKVFRFLAERGRNAEIDEVRKWFQPVVPALKDRIDDILKLEEMDTLVRDALPEGTWQPAVALSQTLLLLGVEETSPEELKTRLKALLDVWKENPVNYSALLCELRKRTISLGRPDRSIVETLTFDPSKQSYFSSEISSSGVEFFLNYLRFEEGVDVDSVVESLRKLFEREQLVGEFLRLCGIDELVGPEEFLGRVEKGVDVMIKAREQGLDLEEVLKRWDELANGGGERFVYLERAVREVADAEVGRRFWEEVEKVLEELGVPVLSFEHHRDREFVEACISLGLVRVEPEKVEVSGEMRSILENGVKILEKFSPSALYSLGDLVQTVKKVGLEGASSAEEVVWRVSALSKLSPAGVKFVLSDPRYVHAFSEAVRKTVLRGFNEGRFVEAVEEAIKESPTPANFLGLVLENVHREEGA